MFISIGKLIETHCNVFIIIVYTFSELRVLEFQENELNVICIGR